MAVYITPVPHMSRDENVLELHCSVCNSYFGWYRDSEYDDAVETARDHERTCGGPCSRVPSVIPWPVMTLKSVLVAAVTMKRWSHNARRWRAMTNYTRMRGND